MTPKEIAAQYEAKVFDTPEAAKVAGFVCTETLAPRNVWNKASAALAIVTKLAKQRASGNAKEIKTSSGKPYAKWSAGVVESEIQKGGWRLAALLEAVLQ